MLLYTNRYFLVVISLLWSHRISWMTLIRFLCICIILYRLLSNYNHSTKLLKTTITQQTFHDRVMLEMNTAKQCLNICPMRTCLYVSMRLHTQLNFPLNSESTADSLTEYCCITRGMDQNTAVLMNSRKSAVGLRAAQTCKLNKQFLWFHDMEHETWNAIC